MPWGNQRTALRLSRDGSSYGPHLGTESARPSPRYLLPVEPLVTEKTQVHSSAGVNSGIEEAFGV